jgi:hypothetical protein
MKYSSSPVDMFRPRRDVQYTYTRSGMSMLLPGYCPLVLTNPSHDSESALGDVP